MKKYAESVISPGGLSKRDPSRRSSNRFHLRGSTNRIFPIILFIIGFLQFYVFWFLYYTLDLYILGCISAIVGSGMQFIGLIKLYLSSRSTSSAKTLIGVLVGSIGLYAWFFVYFGMLIARHIWII